MAQTELPYKEQTPPNWATVIDTWRWEPIGSPAVGWTKSGPCPVCGHDMSVDLGLVQGIEGVMVNPKDAYCNCTTAHAAGQTGCGASGDVSGPDQGDGN